MDKSVTLSVDGDARAVKTYASTVGGVLDDQNITVSQHDTLAPGRNTRISDGAEIVLAPRPAGHAHRGRPQPARCGPPRPPCRTR